MEKTIEHLQDRITGLFGLEGVVETKPTATLTRYISSISFFNDGTISEIHFIYLEED